MTTATQTIDNHGIMEIKVGTKSVKSYQQDGVWYSRSFVNNGETAGYHNAEHKTQTGAIRWAHRVLLGM